MTALVIGGMAVARAETGDKVSVVLNQTPFYAESGGQVGDAGTITGADGLRIAVSDTQKRAGDVFAHIGVVEAGSVAVGAAVAAELDHRRRGDIRAHHSATHLLHEALRRRAGDACAAEGQPERAGPAALRRQPADADRQGGFAGGGGGGERADPREHARDHAADDAGCCGAEGAMALFGEKYGDEVRVVAMGEGGEDRPAYSIELCGGTHVRRTGDIGLFRLLSEGAVSAGVRRIEAVTGPAALALIGESERRVEEVAGLLKSSPADVPMRVATLIEDRKRLERQVSELQRKLATGTGAPELEEINGIRLAARNVGEVPGKELRGLVEAIAKLAGSSVVAVVSTAEGKASVAVGVSPDLVKRVSAVDLVRAASVAVGGKGGGGRPDMAQAGGPDGERAEDALEAIRAALQAV